MIAFPSSLDTTWSTNVTYGPWFTTETFYLPPRAWPNPRVVYVEPLSARVLARLHLARFTSPAVEPSRPAACERVERAVHRVAREYRLRPGMRRRRR